jgi:hypothetical protein
MLLLCLEFSVEMPLTPRNVVSMLNSWYNDAEQMMLKEQVFFNVARELVGARSQCATSRINQVVSCEYQVPF